MMTNDKQITISSAGSRKATQWPAQTLYWSELVNKLSVPVRGTETLTKYLKLPKSRQDVLKDVGGFVAGTLKDNKRKANSVTGRDIITLDFDNIQPGETKNTLLKIDSLGCSYAVYSTRKHEESKPRLRVLIPTNRTVTADEYEPLARKMASIIGIKMCDPTTFEASRLMYWPSCCKDSQYIFQFNDKPFLDADGVLSMYTDWHNMQEWPEVPGVKQKHIRLAAKQGEPTEKAGIVGAFCKTYDIYKAMEVFIPGTYEPVIDNSERFTYTGGSTVGGAVIYDNGKFLYSHHATDPAGGKLCNSFDLVRMHKFSELDDEALPGTPVNKLASYKAMCEFAVKDKSVSALLNQERYEKATQDFNTPADDMANWISKLKLNSSSGTPAKDPTNVSIMLGNDPLLKGKIKKDLFANRIFGQAPLPWGNREFENDIFSWTDDDDAGLRIYTNKVLGFRSKDIIEDAFKDHTAKNSYNPVVNYLKGLTWDGIKRLDKLFINYLGAADTPYTRAVTRKAFTAAVARAMTPGIKFDNMTILTGAQGKGKSTLLKKMGRKWFSDSIKTFEGKEACELVQGVWIIEIGELEAFNRSEIGRIKQFLSQQEDIYRAAYGRNTEWHPRRCVFFGTSNNGEYLRDKTGNRRFWPVDIGVIQPVKNVWDDLDNEVDQLWAEAYTRWQLGETLYLSGDIEKDANEEQESHREHSTREGLVREFIEKQIPEDWNKWVLDRRRMYWSGCVEGDIRTVDRSHVCALEIWCELFNGDFKGMKYTDAAEINSIIGMIDGWKKQKKVCRFGYCGPQRGFEKV